MRPSPPFSHAVRHAHAERAFLRVAERDRHDAGVQIDVHDEEAGRREIEELDLARLVHDFVAVGGAPFVVRRHPGAVLVVVALAGARADDAAGVGVLGPEIDALDALDFSLQFHALGDDVAVGEPGRLLVRMIDRAARLGGQHRPAARDLPAVGGLQRPEIGFVEVAAKLVDRRLVLVHAKLDVRPVDPDRHVGRDQRLLFLRRGGPGQPRQRQGHQRRQQEQ